jgi:hypothetical protein
MKRVASALLLFAACTTESVNVGNSITPTTQHVLGDTRWALRFGGGGNDSVGTIAMDSNGDVIAAGVFQSADFGHGLVEPATGAATFLTKRSAGDGGEVWTRIFESSGAAAFIGDVAVDEAGDVYIAGTYGGQPTGIGTVTFDGHQLTAEADTFLAKLDRDGAVLWVRGLGSATFANTADIAVGGGRIYQVGSFRGTLSFPTGSFTALPDTESTYVAAYDTDGTLLWGRTAMTTSTRSDDGVVPGGVAIASDGDVMLSASFVGTITFGGVELASGDLGKALVARYSPAGDLRWRELTAVTDFSAGPIATRSDGTRVVLVEAHVPGSAVVASDHDGDPVWRVDPSPYSWSATALTLADATVIAGNTISRVELGDVSIPQSMLFVAAFDQDGAYRESRAFGGPTQLGPQRITDIATQNGAVAFSATTSSDIDFGTGPVGYGGHSFDGAIVYLAPP